MLRSLPGISFEAKTLSSPDRFPRMDVAAFVGFAAAGPLNTPVPVEDEVHFQEIFGEDLPLAWDLQTGAQHMAYLGPAVRLFFRNGGRRCWVVRVARPSAEYNRFLVPGLVAMPSDAQPSAAMVRARSEGSWSDSLRVGATLNHLSLGQVKAVTDDAAGSPQLWLTVDRRAGESLRLGDLVRVAFGPDLVLYMVVDVIREQQRSKERFALPAWEIRGREYWFRSRRDGFAYGNVQLMRLLEQNPPDLVGALWLAQDRRLHLHRFCMPAHQAPQVGSMLALREHGLLMTVTQVVLPYPSELAPYQAKLDRGEEWRLAMCLGALEWLPADQGREEAARPAAHPHAILAERLTFDLRAANEHGKAAEMRNLGFTAAHPRFLGHLPTDEALFRPLYEQGALPDGDLPGAALRQDANHPRFPLAGPMLPADVYLPLGMEFVSDFDYPVQAEPTERPAPVRNGLDQFSPDLLLNSDLFLNASLADTGAAALEREIFHQHDGLPPDKRERLRGLHALWPLEEVTLFAVPDLAHPPWSEVRDESTVAVEAPDLRPPVFDKSIGQVRLDWAPIAEARAYAVEMAADPTFPRPVQFKREREPRATFPSSELPLYVRVRAVMPKQKGPWSATCYLAPPDEPTGAKKPFEHTEAPVLELKSSFGRDSRFWLHWSHTGGDEYLLQESDRLDFANAITVYRGTGTGPVSVSPPARERYAYYRVRASEAGHAGLWSRTIVLAHQERVKQWRLRHPTDAEWVSDLRARARIHRAMLRMAEGRGDMFAVLTVPTYYRHDQVATYVQYLQSDVGDDKGALSFGGIYHPWVWLPEEKGAQLWTPPDGAVLGTMAARALERGAWVAPANVPMRWVSALDPALPRHQVDELTRELVNVLRPDSRGFLVLSANTLSPEPEYRSINVRRLLSLLRRVAQRAGTNLVFEPNIESTRRRIKTQFERLLSELYVRGALKGDTQAEAYQVVAESPVETLHNTDIGRIIVELRVAPSQPLSFITVRLLQAHGARPEVTEG